MSDTDPFVLIQQLMKLFDLPLRDDDTDAVRAVAAVFRLMLDDELPQYESVHSEDYPEERRRVGKAELLERAVCELESVVGRSFQRAPSMYGPLPEISGDGASSVVRPEDVSEELREVTIRYWQRQHAKWQKQFEDVPLNSKHEPTARLLVAEAREAGAFMVPWELMPDAQRWFWLQRAAGFEHRIEP